MISKDTLPQLLTQLGFKKQGAIYSKTIGTAVLKVDTKEARINARLLELMMRAQKKHLNEIAPQMAQKNINIEILKPIKVPVPPLADQQKLVAEVEAQERTIASAQAVIAAAPAKKQAIMQRYL